MTRHSKLSVGAGVEIVAGRRLRVMRELDIIVYGRAWRCILDGNEWKSWWKRVEHNKSWQRRRLMPASKSTSATESESHRINESGAKKQTRVVSTVEHPLQTLKHCQLLLLLFAFAIRTYHSYISQAEKEKEEGRGRTKANPTGRSHLGTHIRQIFREDTQHELQALASWTN